MNSNQTGETKGGVQSEAVYMAMELGSKHWKLLFSPGDIRRRAVTVAAGDLSRLRDEVVAAKQRFALAEEAVVLSCYEAGRDGFWIHRALGGLGVANFVVDSASIEVNRRKRRTKTDGADAESLLRLLVRYVGGESKVWSVARVPSVADDDDRRLHRELHRLKKERTGHQARIQALLATVGVLLKPGVSFADELAQQHQWDGTPLPACLTTELRREFARLELVRQQVAEIEKDRLGRLAQGSTDSDAKAAKLATLRGIGPEGAWVLAKELFGWRQFRNRRELGALVGLTPTPYSSGNAVRDQGISKSGNVRVRTLLNQLAWDWLRFQPSSSLTAWYNERFAAGGSRIRRIGITALARKLLIALWHYVEHDIVPEGAVLKRQPKQEVHEKEELDTAFQQVA
jgi:transposase